MNKLIIFISMVVTILLFSVTNSFSTVKFFERLADGYTMNMSEYEVLAKLKEDGFSVEKRGENKKIIWAEKKRGKYIYRIIVSLGKKKDSINDEAILSLDISSDGTRKEFESIIKYIRQLYPNYSCVENIYDNRINYNCSTFDHYGEYSFSMRYNDRMASDPDSINNMMITIWNSNVKNY